MLSFDRTFHSDTYALREGIADPARRPVHRYPDVAAAPGTVTIVVQPAHAPSWTGQFGAPDYHCPDGITGVIALPDGRSFGVLNEGALHLVDVENPDRVRRVRSGGVHQAVALRADGLVLCADETTIVAFGEDGLLWETESPNGAGAGARLRITAIGEAVRAEWRRADSRLAETLSFDTATGSQLVYA